MAIELAEAYVSILPSTKGLGKAIQAQVSSATKGIASMGAETGAKFGDQAGKTIRSSLKNTFSSRLGRTLKVGGIAAGTALAAGIGFAVKKGLDRLVDIENADAKLQGLGHSAQAVKGIMDDALASVKGTAFGMGEAANVAANAVAAGIKPGQELQRTLKLTADAATVGGISMAEMGSIFNKVASSNKIQADVANQLLDRGIPIWELLGMSMGKTSLEVQALASQGKVSFADFQKAMEEGLGGSALTVGNTTAGALRNIGAAAGRLGATLLGGVFPKIKPLFVSIIGALDRLTAAAEPLAAALGAALAPAISALTTYLDNLRFDNMQSFMTSIIPSADGARVAVGGFGKVLEALKPLGTILSGSLGLISGALGFLGDHIGLIGKLLPFIIGGFIAWRVASFVLEQQTERLRMAEVAMAPVYLANQVLRFINIRLERQDAAAKGQAALATLRETTAINLNTRAAKGNTIATRLSAAAQKWHQIATQGLLTSMVRNRLSMIGSTVAMAGHRIATLASAGATKIATLAQRGLNLAMKAAPWMIVASAIGAVVFGLYKFFTQTKEGRAIWVEFTSELSAAVAPLKAQFESLKPAFDALTQTLRTLVSTVVGQLAGALSAILPQIASVVSQLVTAIIPVITTLMTQLVPVISGLIASFLPTLASLIGQIASVFTQLLQAVIPVVSVLVTALMPVIQAILTVIVALVKVLVAILVPIIQVLAKILTWIITTIIVPLVNFISVILVNTLNVLGPVLQKVGEWFVNVWNNWVKPACEWIKAGVGVVVAWFQTTVAPIIQQVVRVIGQVFQWLWTNIVQPVWNSIKTVVSAVVEWFKAYVLPVIQAVFTAVGAVFQWLWNKVIKPVIAFIKSYILLYFTAIKIYFQVWWTAVKAIFTALVWFIENVLAPVFTWLWNNIIKPVFKGIKLAITRWWVGVKIIFQAVVNFVKNVLAPVFRWLWNSVITPVWNGIKSVIVSVWNFIRDRVFSPLVNAVKNTIPAAFRSGRDAIRRAWDALKDIAKKPVKFVVQTVMNDGLIKSFNRIAGVFPGAPKIPEVSLPKGFARGGWTGPGARLQPAGIVHADEFVIRKESRKRFEKLNPGVLDYINLTGRLPGIGYAGGGRVMLTDAARWWQQQGARITEFGAWGQHVGGHSPGSLHYSNRAFDVNYGPGGENAIEKAFFDSHVAEFKRLFPGIRVIWRAPGHYNHLHADNSGGADIGATGPGSGSGFDILGLLKPFEDLKGSLSKLGESTVGQIIKLAAQKLVQAPIDWIKDRAGALGDFGSKVVDTVAQGTVKAQVHAVASAYGWGVGPQWQAIDWIVNKESSWNPKAANPTSSARGLFQKMTSLNGPVEATAAGQAGWGLKYIKQRYGTPVAAMNFHKSHGWYDRGGLVKPVLFDAGGVLSPGVSLVENRTRRPEYVLPAHVTDALMRSDGEQGQVINITINGIDSNNASEVAKALRFEMTRQRRGGRYAPA